MSDDVSEPLAPCPNLRDNGACGCPAPKRCPREWMEPCEVCGEPIKVNEAMMGTVGAYHSGCFGSPWCRCMHKHQGDCP